MLYQFHFLLLHDDCKFYDNNNNNIKIVLKLNSINLIIWFVIMFILWKLGVIYDSKYSKV